MEISAQYFEDVKSILKSVDEVISLHQQRAVDSAVLDLVLESAFLSATVKFEIAIHAIFVKIISESDLVDGDSRKVYCIDIDVANKLLTKGTFFSWLPISGSVSESDLYFHTDRNPFRRKYALYSNLLSVSNDLRNFIAHKSEFAERKFLEHCRKQIMSANIQDVTSYLLFKSNGGTSRLEMHLSSYYKYLRSIEVQSD